MLFFTSDHHFGHANILRYCDRPFRDIDEMARALIDNWNEVVAPSDEVWVVGDIAMGNRQETLQAVKELHGEKYLIPGNHDLCWRGHKSWEMHIDMYYDVGFKHIFKKDPTVEIDGTEILVSHFPYPTGDKYDSRFSDFQPEDKGEWLIHGHVHNKWRQNEHMLNASVEAWNYFPVSADTLAEFIEYGPAFESASA